MPNSPERVEQGWLVRDEEAAHVKNDRRDRGMTECPNCGTEVALLKPGHETGCVLGALLTVIEDRGEMNFAGTDIEIIDSAWLWDRLGPLTDDIELDLQEHATGD